MTSPEPGHDLSLRRAMAHDSRRGPPSNGPTGNASGAYTNQQPNGRTAQDLPLSRSTIICVKIVDKKSSEHPAAGKTRMTPVRSLPKRSKKLKRPKR